MPLNFPDNPFAHLPGPSEPLDAAGEAARLARVKAIAVAAGVEPERLDFMLSDRNPEHGEDGHDCLIYAVTGSNLSRVFEMLADGTPQEWIMANDEERDASLSRWRATFLRGLTAALRDNGKLAADGEPSREQIIWGVNALALAAGMKPPDMLLASLDVTAADIEPMLVARSDQKKAEFMSAVRKWMPGVEGAGSEVSAFEDMMAGSAPEGHVLYNGTFIPQAEHDAILKDQAEVPESGYTADSPYEARLGGLPFVLLELREIDGTELTRLDFRMGGGATRDDVLFMLESAYGRVSDGGEGGN